ncbi:MAG: DUF4231 domain-containing protein [Candidatus Thiodiazotropha sp.]
MDSDEYISQRLEDQINWYDKKSQSAQVNYKRIRLVEFFCAATIPFLAGMMTNDSNYLKVVVGVLGVVVAIITAVQGLYQWNEDWIQYRTTCESLKKEKFLFLTKSEPYDSDERDNLNLLVQRVETLVSKENTNWAQYMMNPPEHEKHRGEG